MYFYLRLTDTVNAQLTVVYRLLQNSRDTKLTLILMGDDANLSTITAWAKSHGVPVFSRQTKTHSITQRRFSRYREKSIRPNLAVDDSFCARQYVHCRHVEVLTCVYTSDTRPLFLLLMSPLVYAIDTTLTTQTFHVADGSEAPITMSAQEQSALLRLEQNALKPYSP